MIEASFIFWKSNNYLLMAKSSRGFDESKSGFVWLVSSFLTNEFFLLFTSQRKFFFGTPTGRQ